MRKELKTTFQKFLNESDYFCPYIQLTEEIIEEVNRFNTSEELLRSGGIPIEALDRAAFGFSSDDIKVLMPKDLHIKWKDDLENVKYEIRQLQKKYNGEYRGDILTIWARGINLEEPIDVSYEKNKFYIEDGHHRYYAAKILNKPLNVSLEIETNPIKKLAPSLSYDDFHRCVFNQVKGL
jgi:hypothetical protein